MGLFLGEDTSLRLLIFMVRLQINKQDRNATAVSVYQMEVETAALVGARCLAVIPVVLCQGQVAPIFSFHFLICTEKAWIDPHVQKAEKHLAPRSSLFVKLKPPPLYTNTQRIQVRAAEDVLSLTRDLKESWLFGKLQTVGASEAEKRADEYAADVAEGLRRLGGSKESLSG